MMTNEKKKVFHPTLGICDVLESAEKQRFMMQAKDGSTCSLPIENLSLAGIREVMGRREAQEVLTRLLQGKPTSMQPSTLTLAKLQDSIVHKKMDIEVQNLINLLHWKFSEGKSGIRYQECLDHMENILCEELSFVLEVSKCELMQQLETCYIEIKC